MEAIYYVALSVGSQLSASQTRLKILLLLEAGAGEPSTSNDPTCVESFNRGWGSRVMRYPIPAPVDRAVVADIVVTMVASPRFLYRAT